MSLKQWLALLFLFVCYLFLGTLVFYHIERIKETNDRQDALILRGYIMEQLEAIYLPNFSTSHVELLKNLTTYCNKPFYDASERDLSAEPVMWTFFRTFLFVVTVVTTVGYGNVAPQTSMGRILMIFYALIGIPMNGIVLTYMGDFFGKRLLKIHRRYKAKRNDNHARTWMVTDVLSYLVPGLVIFIFLPAAVISYMETDWDYVQSVYYAFVTLSTIGFGDIVAATGNTRNFAPELYAAYESMLIIWIFFGLGFLIMILGFITRGMRSKRIARLEHKLAMNLKMTQNKLWHGLTKDVSYLRRVLNEMYLQKLRPVYHDDEVSPAVLRTRSSSDPCLYLPTPGQGLDIDADTPPLPGVWRRRANSDFVGWRSDGRLQRVLSETDLQRIDKAATFASASAVIQPAELLARVVSALGVKDEPQGVHCFSDDQILASEGSRWTLGDAEAWNSAMAERKPRSRAASDVKIPIGDIDAGYDAEWTWSGVGGASSRVHRLIRDWKKGSYKKKRAPSIELPKSTSPLPPVSNQKRPSLTPSSWLQQLNQRWRKPSHQKKPPKPSLLKRKSLPTASFFHQNDDLDDVNIDDTRRSSIFSPENLHYLTHTGGMNKRGKSGGLDFFSSGAGEGSDVDSVLEETSLADFLRALTSIHARIASVNSHIDVQSHQQPRGRKDGTASFTPPYGAHSSLSSVFAPPPPSHLLQRRRFSVRPDIAPVPGGSGGSRRSSLAPPPSAVILAKRRSSLRPPDPWTPPPPTSQLLGATRTSSSIQRQQRTRFSVRRVSDNIPPGVVSGLATSGAGAGSRNLRQEVLKANSVAAAAARTRHDSLKSVVVDK